MQLHAPVDGTVQQLAVHTIGGVVTPAQPLLLVVPSDESLEVEATILNKDIGFVRQGQPVTVKVESFPYTRYGYRSEEHTSELQSLMRTSYAVFCLKKKIKTKHIIHNQTCML